MFKKIIKYLVLNYFFISHQKYHFHLANISFSSTEVIVETTVSQALKFALKSIKLLQGQVSHFTFQKIYQSVFKLFKQLDKTIGGLGSFINKHQAFILFQGKVGHLSTQSFIQSQSESLLQSFSKT